VFFVSIGLSVAPADLLPMLPFALGLAAVTAVTKVVTGAYAARREGAARPGQRRAGTALIARGEFSLVIIGLAGTGIATLSAVATPYVFILAIVGPVLTRFAR
jgi:CPA2 family monovalent cation:H+ antiporter-2